MKVLVAITDPERESGLLETAVLPDVVKEKVVVEGMLPVRCPAHSAILHALHDLGVPLVTDLAFARALVEALRCRKPAELDVIAWNDLLAHHEPAPATRDAA